MKQVGEGRVSSITANLEYVTPPPFFFLFSLVTVCGMTATCLFKVMEKGIDET